VSEILYAFGVGCFQFQSTKSVDTNGENAEYFRNLKNFLQQDNSVKDVIFSEFEFNNYINDYDSDNRSETQDISDLEYLYPHFSHGKIEIKITIPFRLQKEYLGSFRDILTSENFTIVINFNDTLPVAFIYPEKYENSPSTSTVIVWKHFKKNFKEKENIEFLMLGPSPFHADFFVYAKKDSKLEISYNKKSGYDEVNIFVSPDVEVEFLKEITEYRLKDEIGPFYDIVKFRNSNNRQIYKIYEDIETLSQGKKGNLWAEFLKKDRLAPDIYSSLINLEKIQLEIEENGRQVKEMREHIENRFGHIGLNQKITSAENEIRENPIKSFKNILSTIKDRNFVNTTNNSVVFAAISGVVIGFLLNSLNYILRFLYELIVMTINFFFSLF